MGNDIYTSLSGLNAAQRLIQTSMNNIANSGNESYARQRVSIVTNPNAGGKYGLGAQMGTGVLTTAITRIRDELLIQQARSGMGQIGYYGGKTDVLTNIESIFGETGDNALNQLIKNMFDSFEEAGKFPEQSSYRIQAINDARLFSHKIRHVTDEFDTIKQQTDVKITNDVQRVNALLKNIANVNERMQSMATDSPNALLDERDRYLDELSEFIDVETIHKAHPMNLEIRIGNATLLSGKDVHQVTAHFTAENQQWVLGATDVVFKPKAGSLAGYLETRNSTINEYEAKLNSLVQGIMTEVNALHQGGFAADGTTGVSFFTGSDIRTIDVNGVLLGDPMKLAVSGQTGVAGDGSVATAISSLRSAKIIQGLDPINFYQGLVIDMGSELNVAEGQMNVHMNVYQAVSSQRQSVQGVNIDEEMTNLMTYQQFYQANARGIKIQEKLMEDLLSIL